ncbi:hypothetical protein A3B51_02170 [Candidatus Curtissbacteria bacterium RIFCSPLOWO2_01_FULL_41_18]|uniref:EamA domain-containing protein n=2 Tax=Candidatus Curtissiibacteriota TaxID=1752717 RepID=A0A1F5FYS6_9BACT|nr:MAG: hypothetical protein A2696_00370 [Candidatus Curtissbacteria bacterium RIFCSPHIGHO2_01_FULL_41_13]OGE04999.1 MAG: hypothetical protein A3B51_02170 [Candidatus Curtissbacteria bacterium RIFCSPLOWO2_01_FULL_41_18]
MSLLVFLFTSIIGGAGSPLIKFTLNYFPTVIFVALRAFFSALIILPFIYRELIKIKPKQIQYLIFANALFAGNWLFFALGIQKTSVIMGQIIYLPTALIVAIIAYFFLNEKLAKEQIYGLVITILGFAILTYGSVRSQDTLSFGTPVGNLLVVAGLLCWSLYTVISRKISNLYKPQLITFFNFAITAMITFLILPFELKNGAIKISSAPALAIFGFLGVVTLSSILFFFLYQWLIKNTSAFISSLVLYPVTLFASLAGVILFDERLTLSFAFGSMFVLIGVFLATSYQYIKNNLQHEN